MFLCASGVGRSGSGHFAEGVFTSRYTRAADLGSDSRFCGPDGRTTFRKRNQKEDMDAPNSTVRINISASDGRIVI
jgi:hypothetical protein